MGKISEVYSHYFRTHEIITVIETKLYEITVNRECKIIKEKCNAILEFLHLNKHKENTKEYVFVGDNAEMIYRSIKNE